ncbi:Uncharacterised protein [Mycobacterium tuberculosis]|nr:Uncharacterised protein [Mycobacterium tuberculosis]
MVLLPSCGATPGLMSLETPAFFGSMTARIFSA